MAKNGSKRAPSAAQRKAWADGAKRLQRMNAKRQSVPARKPAKAKKKEVKTTAKNEGKGRASGKGVFTLSTVAPVIKMGVEVWKGRSGEMTDAAGRPTVGAKVAQVGANVLQSTTGVKIEGGRVSFAPRLPLENAGVALAGKLAHKGATKLGVNRGLRKAQELVIGRAYAVV